MFGADIMPPPGSCGMAPCGGHIGSCGSAAEGASWGEPGEAPCSPGEVLASGVGGWEPGVDSRSVRVTGLPDTPAAEPVTLPGDVGMLDVAGGTATASPGDPSVSLAWASLWGEAVKFVGRSKAGAASMLGGGGGSAFVKPARDGGNIGGALGDIGDNIW